ncbi:flippase [Pedobacter terrae]|uniref:flippase n=1 Tax=Pedobacter terrae TaxID=405671 RepID=UPI002FF9645B
MSIKKNFFYNGILSVSNYIFPFLTFPYVSRVLGVENMGKCNFVDGVINYFLLFASLGIGAVGIREIAKAKDDRLLLNRVFSSFLVFNLITTTLVCLVYVCVIFNVAKFQEYRLLLYMGLGKIVFTLFMVEWFFAGLENFKFITARSIGIKFCYVILVFFLVKRSSDYQIYFLLTVLITVIGAAFNLYHSRKFVTFSFKELNIVRYWRAIVIMGIYSLLTYMYTSFNVIYLGFVSGDRQVGYYTTATKIYTILLSVFTAFTTVMLPRMSQLVSQNKIEEIKKLIEKSYDALFVLSIPILVIGTLLAPQIVHLIAGPGFEGAVVPMQIVMPLILIIGIAEILIIQILMPFNNDKHIFINSLAGALVGIILNVLLVHRLQAIGSSIALLLSEIAVVISANYFVKREVNLTIPYRKFIINTLYAFPYVLFCWVARANFTNSMVILISVFTASFLYLILIQRFFLKNSLLLEIESTVKSYLPRSKR